MKKALRIGYNRYYCDENFAEHLAFVKRNIAYIDEITLFAEYCHYGYWDAEFTKTNTEILTRRIRQYREAGVKSVGINILNTRGHTNDGWSVLPHADLQYEVDSNGNEHPGCLCFANDAFEAYITERYAAYAKTGADFIWHDDDIRRGNGMRGCMCDGCIEKFNRAYGYNLTRQELVEQWSTNHSLVSSWQEFQNKLLIRLVQILEKAVHDVDPKIKIGYMSFFNDPSVLRSSGAVMCRPGGGFYDERTPMEVFSKCANVQSQVMSYPPYISDIQYEYEAFNYQSLDKSMHMTELETTLALMSGCNGVLYNNDIFYDRQPLLDMLASCGKKWDALTQRNKDLQPVGVLAVGSAAMSLNQIGIPIAYRLDNAVCCFVQGDCWGRYDDETVKQILRKGVFTDGLGLEILTKRGFGDFCGGKVKKAYPSGMAERFADHAFCGKYKGHYRDAFMNFTYYHNNTGNAYELEPAQNAQVVSDLEVITHQKLGCSLYVYEGENSARFAADGYFFPNSIRTYGKKEQLTNVLDWISCGKLPVKTPETVKLIPTVRADAQGNMTVMLTNASLDHTGKFEVEVRSDKELFLIGQDGQLKPVAQRKEGGSIFVTVGNIDRWDYILLTNMR